LCAIESDPQSIPHPPTTPTTTHIHPTPVAQTGEFNEEKRQQLLQLLVDDWELWVPAEEWEQTERRAAFGALPPEEQEERSTRLKIRRAFLPHLQAALASLEEDEQQLPPPTPPLSPLVHQPGRGESKGEARVSPFAAPAARPPALDVAAISAAEAAARAPAPAPTTTPPRARWSGGPVRTSTPSQMGGISCVSLSLLTPA
jgi:hypothetical protein